MTLLILCSDLIRSRLGKSKILLISRHMDGFRNIPNIDLRDLRDGTRSDVKKFISFRLEELKVDCITTEKIKENLVEKAQGTFLWVGFAIDELKTKSTSAAIFEALNHIPAHLRGIYDRILQGIAREDRTICANILRWVAFAVRPLTVDELVAAVKTDRALRMSTEGNIHNQISQCCQLLNIRDGKVTFVHQSARDHLLLATDDTKNDLLEFKLHEKNDNATIAIGCLTYMESHLRHSSDGTIDHDPIAVTAGHVLLEYVLENWTGHACCAHRQFNTITETFPAFFQPGSTLFKAWVTWKCEQSTAWEEVSTLVPADSGTLAMRLKVAVCSCSAEWTQKILSKPRSRPQNIRNLLQWQTCKVAMDIALYSGFKEVAQAILDSGAIPNCEEFLDGLIELENATALKCFAELNPRLRSRKYDWTVPSPENLERTSFAAEALHVKIKRHIRKKKSMQGLQSYALLQKAVHGRHVEFTKLLLAAGVPVAEVYDPYSRTTEAGYQNVLATAIRSSNPDLPLLLILLENTTKRTENKSNRSPIYEPLCVAATFWQYASFGHVLLARNEFVGK